MIPEEARSKVQNAYTEAIGNRSVQRFHSSNLTDLFRDLKLYGQEAGADFVRTNLTRIVQEAVETASCKSAMLELALYGCGQAAIRSMADTLREATLLHVEVHGATLKLIWADTNPRLV